MPMWSHEDNTYAYWNSCKANYQRPERGAVIDLLEWISDEDDKFLPVLVRYVDKDSGLIATSLLDMRNINSGSTASQKYDVCNEVREAFSLDWDNCVTYSSDNTNSMIRQCKSLLQKIRSAQIDQKIFDVGYPCHICVL